MDFLIGLGIIIAIGWFLGALKDGLSSSGKTKSNISKIQNQMLVDVARKHKIPLEKLRESYKPSGPFQDNLRDTCAGRGEFHLENGELKFTRKHSARELELAKKVAENQQKRSPEKSYICYVENENCDLKSHYDVRIRFEHERIKQDFFIEKNIANYDEKYRRGINLAFALYRARQIDSASRDKLVAGMALSGDGHRLTPKTDFSDYNRAAIDSAFRITVKRRYGNPGDALGRTMQLFDELNLSEKEAVQAILDGGKASSIINTAPIDLPTKGYVLGELEGKGLFRADTERSLITIAAPGSGKTQCHVLPNLNEFKGGAIVLDVKGECATHSAKWRHANTGPVIYFSPSHPQHSKRYNPLSFVSQDPDRVWEDSRLLAELLVVPKSQSDPTWETQGRQLLTLLISYVVYMPEERRTMATVLDLLNGLGFDDALGDILDEGSPFPSSMRRTANKFQQMKDTAEKQFQGVLSGASQHLTIFEGAVVERLTAASDWSPLDFRKSRAPTLYLIVKPNEVETYAPLLRVIIAQHVRMLMQEEPERDAPRILFMLDELPRLGKMEPIREALEVGRSYGIQLWMFAQFEGQLADAYGKEIAAGMIESCGVRMYMNPGHETAEKLSKAMGTRENILTGKTEPVVTPQALAGPEWRDDILVFATGEKPLRLKKAFFHEQKQPSETASS